MTHKTKRLEGKPDTHIANEINVDVLEELMKQCTGSKRIRKENNGGEDSSIKAQQTNELETTTVASLACDAILEFHKLNEEYCSLVFEKDELRKEMEKLKELNVSHLSTLENQHVNEEAL